MEWLLFIAVLFLAYSNGANDNFKGVATLFGSGTTDYRKALTWATVATFAGSLTATVLAATLIKMFSGKGLVPDTLIEDPHFLVSVGIAAAATVLLATLTGFPISTTHALTGALVGAGLTAAFGSVQFGLLGKSFFLPLIASPILAVMLALIVYPTLRFTRTRLGVQRQLCLCVGNSYESVQVQSGGEAVLRATGMKLSVGELEQCRERYQGTLVGVNCQVLLNGLHFLSGGAVCFARGLNDTPKIVGLLAASHFLPLPVSVSLVGVVMALGGIISARKVAETMSKKITGMNDGQGFSANLVTSFLVLAASRWGLPVSTTHVSCGALFGIGTVNRQAHWKTIGAILLAWVTTLPLSAGLGALAYWLLAR